MANGQCCNTTSLDNTCTQQLQREKLVKEYCLFDDNSGICREPNECLTMASPARGTCTNTSYVCCVVEAPEDVDEELVKTYLGLVVSTS